MIQEKMKSLILDLNMLIYIHDIIYLRDSNKYFKYSSTYKELHESTILTSIKYLRILRYTLISFIISLMVLRKIEFSLPIVMYAVVLFVSIIFGILFVLSKKEIESLVYQIKAKKAVQYALANFNYEEYKFFLDNYLSEESTKNYYQVYKLKK